MEVQELIADVRHPVEVTHDAVGEAMTPGTEQHRTNDDKRHVGQHSEGEGEGNMQAHTEFSRYFDLTQNPRNKGTRGTNRYDLPESALLQRSQAQSVRQIRWRDINAPDIPRVAQGCTVEN